MAFAVTARSQEHSGTSAVANEVTASFTPAASSLLLLFGCGQIDVGVGANEALPAAPVSDTGGLTWTEQQSYGTTDAPDWNQGTGYRLNTVFCHAPVGAGPAARTVTYDATNSATACYYSIAALDVTGHNTVTPIVQSAKNKVAPLMGNSVSLTVTLGGTAVTNNLVVVSFAAGADGGGGFAAPTYGGQSMTQVYNRNGGSCQNGVWYRIVTGAESTNVITCTDLGTDVGNGTAIVAEIALAAAGTKAPPFRRRSSGLLFR